MTDLPPRVTPDLSEVVKKIDEYIAALEAGQDVSEFKERIADLVCEAFYPAEAGEQFWRFASEKIAAREAQKAERLAQAEVERKGRVRLENDAKEAAAGKTIDEMAEIIADYNRVMEKKAKDGVSRQRS